ncbi:hypothetical protein HUN21_14825 [Acinetobacter oleivorans]|nr:hypothetical protein [Acinetobacter oleivorans]
MIVVAIVVTVVVSYFGGPQAGAAVAKGFTALGASASTAAAAGTVATAATAAAAGSVASQLAGQAMGVDGNFSWTQVGIAAVTAGITKGVTGALTSAGAVTAQSSWTSIAASAVKTGVVNGVINYGSNYIANQVFGNKQGFSWAALGSSIAGSVAASGLGASGVFDSLGEVANPYAYALAGANLGAIIEDKWFGGTKPDYLNVSMAAIANTVGRQFGGYISNKLSDAIVVKAQELKPEEILVNNENDFLNIELAGVSDTDKNNFVERFKSDEFIRDLLFGDKGLITLSNDEQRTNLINASSNYQKHQKMIDGMFDSAENLKIALGSSAGSDGSTGYFSYGGENRTQVVYGNTFGMTLFENASLVKQGIDTFVNQTGIDVEKLSLAASIVMFGPAAVAKDYALNGIINYFGGDQIAAGKDTLTLGMTAWAYSSDLSLMRSGISAENFALAKAGLNDSSALVREESQAAIYRREGILKNQQGAGDLLTLLSQASGISAMAIGGGKLLKENINNFEVVEGNRNIILPGDEDFIGPAKPSFISSSEYAQLRRKTPSQAIRNMVNPIGPKIDPVYGHPVEKLEADHIVSMKQITQMPGFEKLSPELKSEVLNLPENFMGLSKSSNTSKGAKTWDIWDGHSKLGPIQPEIREAMLKREANARKAVQDAINERIRNGK